MRNGKDNEILTKAEEGKGEIFRLSGLGRNGEGERE